MWVWIRLLHRPVMLSRWKVSAVPDADGFIHFASAPTDSSDADGGYVLLGSPATAFTSSPIPAASSPMEEQCTADYLHIGETSPAAAPDPPRMKGDGGEYISIGGASPSGAGSESAALEDTEMDNYLTILGRTPLPHATPALARSRTAPTSMSAATPTPIYVCSTPSSQRFLIPVMRKATPVGCTSDAASISPAVSRSRQQRKEKYAATRSAGAAAVAGADKPGLLLLQPSNQPSNWGGLPAPLVPTGGHSNTALLDGAAPYTPEAYAARRARRRKERVEMNLHTQESGVRPSFRTFDSQPLVVQ